MSHNFKALLGATMVMVAFSATNAVVAQATEKFHCSVEPCALTLEPDGATTTAHHVFIVKNAGGESGSFTCSSLAGDATTTTKTTEEITTTALAYGGTCKINGVTSFNVRMNECDYLFTSKIEAGGTGGGATIHIQCPTAKHIEIENIGTGCIFEVTPQTLRGAHYHSIGTPGTGSTETTVEARVSTAASGTGVAVEVAKEGTGCVPKSKVGETLTGEYTTGNTLVTAEKDDTGVEGWWE